MSVILCDVDDVVADLLGEWIRRYNHDWGDALTRDDFTDWDCTKFVKPECGARFYRYIDQADIYREVKPIEYAQAAIETLRSNGHRVVFVTAGVHPGKYDWLRNYGFVDRPQDYVIAADKSLVTGAALIDDRLETAKHYTLGRAILFGRPHNDPVHGHMIPAHVTRCADWHAVLECF